MKIAISSRGLTPASEVDPRFGRAAYILILDTETSDVEVLDNSTNVNAFKGAGIQAAALLSEKGADVLLTGYCGPKAFQVLSAAKIKVVNDVSGTIKEAIQKFSSGTFSFAAGANAESHW